VRHDFSVQLNNDLVNIIQKFSEHYHDAWAGRKLENSWQYGEHFSDSAKTHPRLKPYGMLSEHVSRFPTRAPRSIVYDD
jgi:ryanodine receptor 2